MGELVYNFHLSQKGWFQKQDEFSSSLFTVAALPLHSIYGLASALTYELSLNTRFEEKVRLLGLELNRVNKGRGSSLQPKAPESHT